MKLNSNPSQKKKSRITIPFGSSPLTQESRGFVTPILTHPFPVTCHPRPTRIHFSMTYFHKSWLSPALSGLFDLKKVDSIGFRRSHTAGF
jgi:hypothetical protein